MSLFHRNIRRKIDNKKNILSAPMITRPSPSSPFFSHPVNPPTTLSDNRIETHKLFNTARAVEHVPQHKIIVPFHFSTVTLPTQSSDLPSKVDKIHFKPTFLDQGGVLGMKNQQLHNANKRKIDEMLTEDILHGVTTENMITYRERNPPKQHLVEQQMNQGLPVFVPLGLTAVLFYFL